MVLLHQPAPGRREDEDHAGFFAAGIGLDAVRQLALAQIRNVDALARGIVGPAVIAAADGAAGRRRPGPAAPGGARSDFPARTPRPPRGGSARSVRPAKRVRRASRPLGDLAAPRHRVPEVGMRPDPAEIGLGVGHAITSTIVQL